jgi:hypothetical protein
MSEPLPRQSDIPDDEEEAELIIDAADLPAVEREYYQRLKTQKSFVKVSGNGMTIQQMQMIDNM